MPRMISDQEDAWYKGQAEIAAFANALYADPNLSPRLKRMIKEKYPQISMPDIDIEDRVEARLAERDRVDQEAKAAQTREEQDRAWQERRAKTQKDYGFTPEGMEKLEKMMVDRNVGDYEVAASYMAAKEPKPSEGSFDHFRWNHDKQPGWAEIAKDPEGWGRGEILKAIRADQERERGQGF